VSDVRLSAKSAAVLKQIGEGRSYEAILKSDPALTCSDIFAAAREALRLLEPQPAKETHDAAWLEAIRANHARAYEPWSMEEDAELEGLVGRSESTAEIAYHLGRRPSAIESRKRRFGLAGKQADR